MIDLTIETIRDGVQKLSIELDGDAEPDDLVDLYLPDGVDCTGGVIISGRAPIWVYGYLVHQLHPTRWVATHDLRLKGGVVVESHHKNAPKVGTVVEL